MANVYKTLEFAKGYNSSFADFIKEFGKVKVFRDMQPKVRGVELKKAWKIACKGNTVKDIKEDGNTNTATGKSEKTNSK